MLISVATLVSSILLPLSVPMLDVTAPRHTSGEEVCSAIDQAKGLCPRVNNDGTEVSIGATDQGGSTGGSGGSGGGKSGNSGGGTLITEPHTPYAPRPGDPVPVECPANDPNLCEEFLAPPVDAAPATITPTLSDVASFAPASLPLVDEPDGVGIVGMPVNFVVDTQTHQQDGTLLGVPLTVRFTPTAVVFDHGDGTTRTAPDGGATWADLALPQFTATPTSHTYTARGTYTAHAVVQYAAEYTFGTGWYPIAGVLEIPTPTMNIQIVEARTALVDKTCTENPHAPGC